MQIHIHNRFTAHQNRFFRAELDELNAEITLQAGGPELGFRTLFERVRGLWRLLRTAWGKSRASLQADPVPDAVFVNTHLELLVFALRRRLARGGRRKSPAVSRPAAVLVSMIVAQKGGRLSSWIRRAYYRRVLSAADLAFCHTRAELKRYRGWYPDLADKLHYQPFGYAVDPHEPLFVHEIEVPETPYLFATGRSSRDYATLIEATRGTSLPLIIACDSTSALPESEWPPHVTVLRHCYDRDLRAMVAGATILVTPLRPVSHSAGQMVVLEGYALGTPQIVTEVPGVVDYTDGGRAARLVPPGSPAALKEAIDRLCDDHEERERLMRYGAEFFEAKLTRRRAWMAMLEAVDQLLNSDVTLHPLAPRHGASPGMRRDVAERSHEPSR